MDYKSLSIKLYRALKWLVYAINDLMPFIIGIILLLAILGYGWGLYQQGQAPNHHGESWLTW